MKQEINEQLIRQYLLGQLPEPEHLRIEEILFGDNEYYQQLLMVEEELTDEYVYDALNAEEREGFERHFLLTPERREDVRIARALKKFVTTSATAAGAETLARTEQPSLWKRFLGFFSGGPVRSFSLVAAALLILIGTSWLVVRPFRTQPTPTQTEAQKREPTPSPALQEPQNSRPAGGTEQTAQNTRRDGELPAQHNRNANTGPELARSPVEKKPATQPTTLAFFLKPGMVRAGEINQVAIPAQANLVRMRLPVLTDEKYGSYQAVLRSDDGREMLRKRALRAVGSESDRVVEVSLPARLLAEGDYQLELSGQPATGEAAPLGKYYFRVSKK